MKTYEEAQAALGDRELVRLPGDVTLQRKGVDLEVEYQGGPLVVYHPNGTVIYAQTRSKKVLNRINEYSPITVVNARGVWKVGDGIWGESQSLSHVDGRIGGLVPSYMEQSYRTRRDQAVRYARSLAKSLLARRLSRPGTGLCAYCSLMVGEQTLGEALQNSAHLEVHVYNHILSADILARAVETAPEEVREEVAPLLRARWSPGGPVVPHADPRWKRLATVVRHHLLTNLHYAL